MKLENISYILLRVEKSAVFVEQVWSADRAADWRNKIWEMITIAKINIYK